MYERNESHEKLVELYRRRVELADSNDDDLKYLLLTQAAEQYEHRLEKPREAIECLGQASALRP